MASAEFEKLQQDYAKLLERHYSTKLSLESQVEALKAENRKLEDQCKGRGYMLIVLVAMLVLSVVLGVFIR